MKTLHCRDLGFDCPGVIHANTEEEVLMQAAQHAKEVHGVAMTPELVEQAKKLIKEETLEVSEE
jgi:predicted small metal-binding protein